MTLRLDRNRPFGEVIPSGGYYQDGHYFDAHGEFVRSDVLPAKKPDEPKAPEPPAPTPVPPVVPVPEPKAPEPAVGNAGEVVVDLAAYARNSEKYPHYMVVRAMKAEYPDGEFGNKRETIVDFLVGKGVVTKDEAVR